MDPIRRFLRRMLALVRRDQFDNDLTEEMAFHREQAEKQLLAEGKSPEAARYAAMRQLGNATLLKERSQEVVGFRFETAWQDLRFAARQLGKNPGFATTAIVVLALGTGATTAIFSALNPILFEPLPYSHADRVVMISEMPKGGGERLPSFGSFHGLAEQSRSFDALAVMKAWQPAASGTGMPERFDGARVSVEYFRALGIFPILGRDFFPADDLFHGPNVVILSQRLWQRRFGSDPTIIGRQITLEDSSSQLSGAGSNYTVVGIMPAAFEDVLTPTAELWAPLQYNPSLPPNSREWGHHLRMIGRLRPGVTRDQAQNELNVILHGLGETYARGFNEAGGTPMGMIVASLQDSITQDVKPALLAVLGAVVLVLIIACVNVTNLLLARGAQRRGEFAMRAALGAGRQRLVTQLLTESLLLAFIGGAFGILVAEIGVRGLVALSPAGLPRAGAIRLDGPVFVFAFAVTCLIGVVVGLIPALQASHRDPQSGLQQSSQRMAASRQAARRSLVVSEVALALVLLVSAGLLLRSLQHLFSINPGFDASHLLTMQVQESGRQYAADSVRAQFFDRVLEAVRQIPGEESAAFTSQLPLSGDFDSYGMKFASAPNESYLGFRYAVTPGYLETMRIPLLRGRVLNEGDRAGAPEAVVISESLAKEKFPGQDPIGQQVRMGPEILQTDKPWGIIVGVVGDVKQLSLGLKEAEAFYTTNKQWAWVDSTETIVVRTRGDAAALAPSVRSAIWSVDKDQPIVRIATMDSLVVASEAQRHFALVLFEIFALVGLVLAATGLYGVLSGSVTERTREIGVRSALGATRGKILVLIMRQGATLTLVGIGIGLLGAAAASRALMSLLFGVSRVDPVTYLAVIVVLGVVSILASSIPAWRAARVDPAITLRAE